jgi:hypothetical protein
MRDRRGAMDPEYFLASRSRQGPEVAVSYEHPMHARTPLALHDAVALHVTAVAIASVCLTVACGAAPEEREDGISSLTADVWSDTGATTGDTGTQSGGTATGEPTADGDSGEDAPKFDLGDGSFCESRAAGTYCDGASAVQCDGNGGTVDTTVCTPGVCVDGQGCVTCTAGQWTCKGPRVMTCNVDGVPYWEEVEVCDPAAGEYCDIGVQGCSPLAPIGDVVPTGEYYLYSTFSPLADGFDTVSDVDSDGNRIWFTAYSGGQLVIAGYDVQLLDSDGDGQLEPHQHPSSVDEPGPIEERVFTFAQSFPFSNDGAVPHQMELYATASTISYAGPNQITAYDLATGITSQVAPKSPWIGTLTYPYLAFLGYDDVNDVWYSGNETFRRVFQYDADTMTWGYAFEFPVLSGDHMDGMDVVTDPSTGIPYVYVSDMTSNFIGQYRHDPEIGWVQENMFTYADDIGVPVEGFGFGALNHFWVGGWNQNSFYEIGGGDLTQFLDPPG